MPQKICYFFNNALEWESRFTLGLNAAKNTDYIKNCLKQKLSRIKFPKKNLIGCISLSTSRVKLGASKVCVFEI